jgi:hypothetical protein
MRLGTFIIFACIALVACSQDRSSASRERRETPLAPPIAEIRSSTDGRLLAAIGKPRPPVGMTMTAAGTPRLGVPLTVQVRVQPGVPVDAISIRWRGVDGLQVVERETALPATAARQARMTTITVVPQSGSGRLVAEVTLTRNGQAQGRTLSLEIPVKGAAVVAAQKPGRMVADSNGERLVVMPAQTEVEQR